MGDNLNEVDLGTDFVPVDMYLGNVHSCVVSMSSEIKCFGAAWSGQAGYENTNSIGDANGEMGDDLQVVDLGTDFNVSTMSIGSVEWHSCAADRNSNEKWKCWGYGQLAWFFVLPFFSEIDNFYHFVSTQR